MRVDHDALSLSVCHTKHNISCLSRDTRKGQKLLHRVWDASTVLLCNHLTRGFDALGLIPEKAARMDHLFEFCRIGLGESSSGPVFLEERRRNDVDHLIRALRRQDRRDQKLERVFVVERTLRIRIRGLEPRKDLFCSKIPSLFCRPVWRSGLFCRLFRCRFCCRCCFPCCHWMKCLSFLWNLSHLWIRPSPLYGHSP